MKKNLLSIFIVLIIIVSIAGGFLVYKNFYDFISNELGKERGTDQIFPEEVSIEEITPTEEAGVSAVEGDGSQINRELGVFNR